MSKESKKEKPWNGFAYLAALARKKEPVRIHLDTNTVEDESPLKGIIVGVDNYTIAFLTEGRELLIYKHAVRFVEKEPLKGG